MASTLDWSTMLAIHGALRRDLEQVGRIAGQKDGDGTRLCASRGWGHFKKFLVAHHQVEDDALWPVLRVHVADFPDQVAVVDALEAEHAVIEPLLEAVDNVAANSDEGDHQLGDIVDELVTKLTRHLVHEESEGRQLIDASLSAEEWQNFARSHGQRLLGDASTYVPWLLEGASPETVEGFLANIPPPLAASYRGQWAPSYAGTDLWGSADLQAPANARRD
jgi:Hemerythrin HHE cation binding domain